MMMKAMFRGHKNFGDKSMQRRSKNFLKNKEGGQNPCGIKLGTGRVLRQSWRINKHLIKPEEYMGILNPP